MTPGDKQAMARTEWNRTAWVRGALDAYEHALVRYAVRITGDLESARDVVQDTFLRLCEAEPAQVDGHLAAWLYTVCRNRALDVRKKEGRMSPLLEGQAEAVASPLAGPGDAAERHEAHRLLLEALDTLPEDQQRVCRLKFQQGLSYREISAQTGLSLGTVSNLMAYAMKALRVQLEGRVDLAPAR